MFRYYTYCITVLMVTYCITVLMVKGRFIVFLPDSSSLSSKAERQSSFPPENNSPLSAIVDHEGAAKSLGSSYPSPSSPHSSTVPS